MVGKRERNGCELLGWATRRDGDIPARWEEKDWRDHTHVGLRLLGDKKAARVLLLDGAQHGRGGEQRLDAVLVDDAEERPRIRRAHYSMGRERERWRGRYIRVKDEKIAKALCISKVTDNAPGLPS